MSDITARMAALEERIKAWEASGKDPDEELQIRQEQEQLHAELNEALGDLGHYSHLPAQSVSARRLYRDPQVALEPGLCVIHKHDGGLMFVIVESIDPALMATVRVLPEALYGTQSARHRQARLYQALAGLTAYRHEMRRRGRRVPDAIDGVIREFEVSLADIDRRLVKVENPPD